MPKHINYGSSKSREADFEELAVRDDLPRAVLRPNEYVLLDGEWKFAVDPEDRGIVENWFIQHTFSQTAHWPGSVEQHLAAYQVDGSSWKDKIVVWYERDFHSPDYASAVHESETILQLTFGACGYETQVWLNGHPLSTIEGERVHIGEYTSFSYELEVLRPVNRLTVRVASSMDADIPRGKQESHVYKRGGIWYQTFTGAVRSIWLEKVERNRLRSRVGVVSIIEDNLVRFTLTTRIHDPGPYKIKLSVFEAGSGKYDNLVAEDEFPLVLVAGQKAQRLVLDIPDALLWSPDSPNQYRLVARLINEKGAISEIETKFGLRKFEARGSHLYLNNEPVYLDGILYQPGNATYDQIRKHLLAMKELGCNLVRIHIAGVDPRIYKLADKIGMLLWVEVPSPHQSTKKSRENHQAELMRMLALIGTHPSVIIWSLYNEDWGAQDIAHNIETRQYIINMYDFMHLAYPQFLVVDNDGWQHISFEGRLKSDLLTAHLYTPDLSHWQWMLDELTSGNLDTVAAFPLVVGDPFFYRKQVPLIVSEWGGFGFENYGGPTSDSARANQIALFKKELRKRSVSGDVYTQATNIEDERNGLIDFETGVLTVPPGLLNSKPDLR
ncbi:glycoside hydrolase family 2 protein [Dyadobacter arcticus]|uniref:Beta-galactosidase/beta-glucuronidase n=1 Tax=Dyadobacter arcticus TaxID=1078754 RepID=A0ABX0UGT8_9BACT|nr:glycoside hydrolase family 2 TIM barrel-domain containing protein [Dyadobacter arcticus]NIJ52122.1 beta-galactosidase/beta-glucuronidase [Dyadobacter arcticus]